MSVIESLLPPTPRKASVFPLSSVKPGARGYVRVLNRGDGFDVQLHDKPDAKDEMRVGVFRIEAKLAEKWILFWASKSRA